MRPVILILAFVCVMAACTTPGPSLPIRAGHLSRAEQLEVFPFVGPALRRLNEAEWRAVVVTNQPVLARGETDEAGLRRIHARLDTEVAREHAYFDRVYVCPHHPDGGFPGEVAALKQAHAGQMDFGKASAIVKAKLG